MDTHQHWPALEKDDAGLMKELLHLLTIHAVGDPYSAVGSFAANIARLPPGLRAMAASHWLDVSLTLDSITWHFGIWQEEFQERFGPKGQNELWSTGLRVDRRLSSLHVRHKPFPDRIN